MNLKLERRFLVTQLPPDLPFSHHESVELFFIPNTDIQLELSVSASDVRAVLITPVEEGFKPQNETPISMDTFKQLTKYTKVKPLTFTKKVFKQKGLLFALELYPQKVFAQADNEFLFTVTVNFSDLPSFESFEPESWFNHEIETFDRYSYENLFEMVNRAD